MDTEAARAHVDSLAKPPGSLGRLEDLAVALITTQGSTQPVTRPRRMVLFAADHGVVAAGVSAWPSEVTTSMIATIASGRSASAALARAQGTDLRLVDVGSRTPAELPEGPHYREARIAPGTRNLSKGAAMDAREFEAAMGVGREEARAALDDGCKVLASGEMGIGNTTAASALCALLTGADPTTLVGPGAGADQATVRRKREIVSAAVAREAPRLAQEPLEALAALGGFEIAAMAGFYLEAARSGCTIVLDGFISGAAALVAQHIEPSCTGSMIAATRSAEPGHAAALDRLGLWPLLEWGLRLGEGSGALLAMPMLDAAAAVAGEMATLAEVTGG